MVRRFSPLNLLDLCRSFRFPLRMSKPKKPVSSVLGLLAIECKEPGTPLRATTDRTHAEAIAAAIGGDLLKLDASISALDLVVAGALFDQAQILRPGWPAHAGLLELQSRVLAVATRAEVLAIAAHDGAMPLPELEPESRLFGSPLLTLPWVLHGDDDIARATAMRFESDLLDRGMAGSNLALALQDAFGINVRHVQHLTVFDLCAIGCAQYQQAGYSAIWELIENALLTPTREHTVEIDGEHWINRGAGVTSNATSPTHAHYRAILAAHGITVTTAD